MPVILIILDGWGIAQAYSGNAISQADTKFFNSLVADYPAMTLRASGAAVGLPWGEVGNSEVGHLNLGSGRIIYQNLPLINKEISEKTFYENESFLKAAEHVKKNNSALHILGLASNGCVHSSIDHLQALLIFAQKNKLEKVFIHIILDGRDTPYDSGIGFIRDVQRYITEYGVGKIATISGRFYTMDRANNWDRIEKGYKAMVNGEGNKSSNPIEAIQASYDKKVYDEEFIPTVITQRDEPIDTVKEGDSVIFFNYRADRARQISKAFCLENFDKIENRKFIKNLFFVCFKEYEKGLPAQVAFGDRLMSNTFGEIIAKAGLKQLRIAETEKYAHVTYFFNGGNEEKQENEDHILVPSPQVNSYDLKPEMSAIEITDKLVKIINEDQYDFILLNFANADMVGHTGNIKAAIKAVETLDNCLSRIIKNVLNKNGIALITADHGNAEVMFNMQTGTINKEHTSNPVPFIIVGDEFKGKTIGFKESPGNDLTLIQPQGILSDIAPTILKIMDIKNPPEMTGRSLI